MNAPVMRELERHRAIERDRREQALASETQRALSYVRPQPDQGMTDRARPFLAYCAAQGVNSLPARCETLAGFLLSRLDLPPTLDSILDTLEAIEAMHDAMAFASPVRSSVVNAALAYWPMPGAPRSWPNADKLEFMRLPPHIQRVVSRREAQRDREVRRLQAQASISTPKGCNMSKEDRGQGHFTRDVPVRESGPKEDKGKSVANDAYSEGTAGAPLPRR